MNLRVLVQFLFNCYDYELFDDYNMSDVKGDIKVHFKFKNIFVGESIPSITFGTSARRCSRSPLGGRLATTLVDRYFHHYFTFSTILRCDLFS